LRLRPRLLGIDDDIGVKKRAQRALASSRSNR
jgi:hypothetical protein